MTDFKGIVIVANLFLSAFIYNLKSIKIKVRPMHKYRNNKYWIYQLSDKNLIMAEKVVDWYFFLLKKIYQ